VDAAARTALALSHLRDLPTEVLEGLVGGSARRRVPAGSVSSREGDRDRHLDLVVSGLVRVYVMAPDGRTMTIRYCRAGALIGTLSLFSASYTTPVTTQALTDSELLALSASAAQRLSSSDVRVARAFLAELSERVMSFIYEIPGSAFATVRQRVVRHLLDLASVAPGPGNGSELVVRLSQQELADAVGTVREVVVRVLRELRAEGVVRTGRDRITIVEPGRLAEQHEWNSGP
jgi:CRP/FNR family transcriptional regulator